MGNSLDRQSEEDTGEQKPKNGRKRAGSHSEGTGSPKKRVATLNTTKYIYNKLFLQGEESDITVKALGRAWKLHRLYLAQCKYFNALINGNWKDSKDNVLKMEISDDNVTAEGLNVVFGSLYHNEIEIDVDNIIGILAAACFIGLESVVSRCKEMMCEHIDAQHIVDFSHVADRYELTEVKEMAKEYLETNFWRKLSDRRLLSSISEEMLLELLSSPNFLIAEGELDIYFFLKRWIYIAENLGDTRVLEAPDREFESAQNQFFQSKKPGVMFVKYSKLFCCLRIYLCFGTSSSIDRLERDGVIPQQVISAVMEDMWRNFIKNEETPSIIETLTDEDFDNCAQRMGRQIDSFPKSWRWTGFNNGVDILMSGTSYSLTLRRNCTQNPSMYSVNFRPEKKIWFRIVIVDVNGKRLFDSERQKTVFKPDEGVQVARFAEELTMPVSIHLQYLSVLPPPQTSVYVESYVANQSKASG